MQRTFELASRPDAIAPALDAIETGLADVGVAQELALELRLISEEVITNVVKYSSVAGVQLRAINPSVPGVALSSESPSQAGAVVSSIGVSLMTSSSPGISGSGTGDGALVSAQAAARSAAHDNAQ